MEEYVLTAKRRAQFGTRAARRLRQEGLLPANIYGHGQENLNVYLADKEFRKFFEAGHRVVKIVIDGHSEEHGVIKDVQYDGLGTDILHVDITRVGKGESITLEVPIEIVGVPHGVSGGGVLEFRHKELKISGVAGRIPESYALNVEAVKLGSLLRIRDLTPPEGCTFLEDPETVVIAVGEAHVEVEEATAEAAATPAEPEVIGRKKESETEGSS
ncbi:MAG: 50S ribosomal protein L25 [Planctomycetes bacterium]|nr:50S ribosomal protein L25 [Planctomycetota bacterium]